MKQAGLTNTKVLLFVAFVCALQCGCRALTVDADGDGLTAEYERICKTSPSRQDSDGNGIPDGKEDPDGDGLTNLQEQQFGTDPFMKDYDGEGYFEEDREEVYTGGTTTDSSISRGRENSDFNRSQEGEEE